MSNIEKTVEQTLLEFSIVSLLCVCGNLTYIDDVKVTFSHRDRSITVELLLRCSCGRKYILKIKIVPPGELNVRRVPA